MLVLPFLGPCFYIIKKLIFVLYHAILGLLAIIFRCFGNDHFSSLELQLKKKLLNLQQKCFNGLTML